MAKASEDFNNTAAGITGGRTELGLSGAYKASPRLSVNGEYLQTQDDIEEATTEVHNESKAFSLGADYQISERLTVGGGVRVVKENAASLVRSTTSSCSNSTTATTTGYNTGFGISQVGNQTIDPVTGLPVVCSGANLTTIATATEDLDRTSVFGRAAYKMTDSLTLSGELQGAPWRLDVPADWNGDLVMLAHGWSPAAPLAQQLRQHETGEQRHAHRHAMRQRQQDKKGQHPADEVEGGGGNQVMHQPPRDGVASPQQGRNHQQHGRAGCEFVSHGAAL